jgi:hypothetical protein
LKKTSLFPGDSMPFGKTVRIFLPEGAVTGIRHAEISNRTGQALACPRSRLDELKDWPEAAKPGVYILFEARLGDSKPRAYIGESENVSVRLLTHDREKEFWNEAVIISNKDDNLTKSHVKYLESRIEALASFADRFSIENGSTPTLSSLSRSEKEAMEELLEDIRLFLGTLGYPLLEPLIKLAVKQVNKSPTIEKSNPEELIFTVHDLVAKGVQTDEGFVLKKGSTASKTNSDSLNNKLANLKEQLIADGRLAIEETCLRLTEDILISSSSYAAALIAGTARSGPQSWFASNGKSLKDIEELAAASASAATGI